MSRRYRNWRIGELLKELDLTEGRGTGISKIVRAMKVNGSPPPVFEFDEDHSYFAVILPIHVAASPRGGTEQVTEQVAEQVAGDVTLQVTHQVDPATPEVTLQVTLQVDPATPEVDLATPEVHPAAQQGGIKATEFTAPEVTPEVAPEVTPEVDRVLRVLTTELSRSFVQLAVGLSDPDYVREAFLLPALAAGLIEMTRPDKPRSSKQRYRLTEKGRAWLARSKT